LKSHKSALMWSVTYLVAMVLEEFHFLLGESCHGDRLDPVGRVEASPGTQSRGGMSKISKQSVKTVSPHVQDSRGEKSRWEGEYLTRDCEFRGQICCGKGATHTLVKEKHTFSVTRAFYFLHAGDTKWDTAVQDCARTHYSAEPVFLRSVGTRLNMQNKM